MPLGGGQLEQRRSASTSQLWSAALPHPGLFLSVQCFASCTPSRNVSPFFPSVSFLVRTADQSSGATFGCNKDPSDDRSVGKECASSSARSFTVLGSRGKYTVAFSSCRYTSIVLCASQRLLRITSCGHSVAIGRNVAAPARREPRSRHFSP